MDKETYRFMYPTGIASFSFRFSDRAMRWLCGTTTDDNGREIGNFTLFGDLLARMALTDGAANGFHRPLMLSAGQTQYSEEQLSSQWNMGRKRIRNLLATLTDMGLIDTCAYRHLPFEGCIRDDLSVPNRVENSGRRYYIKPFYPRTEGRIRAVRSRADSNRMQRNAFPLFHSPAFC